MWCKLLAGPLGLALVACGGGGGGSASAPTYASPPAFSAGVVLSFVSGETNAPVAGARVTVGVATHLADHAGQILLSETVPTGAEMGILADGFLDRRVRLGSSGETRFTLWPRVSSSSQEPDRWFRQHPVGLDELWTQELVYTDYRYCSASGQYPLASASLRRARSGVAMPVSIAPGPLMRDTVERAVQSATDLINVANEGRVVFQPVAGSATGAGITIEVLDRADLESEFIAQMVSTADSAGYITRGRLQFSVDPVQRTDWPEMQRRSWFLGEEEFYTQVIAHELGHALGLVHSYVNIASRIYHWGLMGVYSDSCTNANLFWYSQARDFSRSEKLALKLMFQRRPGNTFPDSDSGVRAAEAEASAVVCRLGTPPGE